MKLNEIMDKLKEAGLEAGVIDAVKALDVSAEVERLTSALDAEKGKNAGILEDKRKFKERAEKAEKELGDIADSKLSDSERADKQKAEFEARIAELEKASAEKDAAYAAKEREANLSRIAGELKLAKGVSGSVASTLVKARLADIEDLSDKSKVEEAIKSLKEENKALFAADVPSGSGGHHNNAGGGDDGNKKMSMKDIVDEAWGK